jgi:hypothetical protein
MMTDSSSSIRAQLGKRSIRFAVAALGLLLLKAVVSALPMLKNASPVASTLLTPMVLANAIVDTLMMVAIFGFGLTVSRELRRFYPRVPDLAGAVLLLAALIVLVLAYNFYEVPLACILMSPQDLASGPGAADFSQLGAQMGEALRQFASGTSGQLPDALKSSAASVMQVFQKLAAAKMRQPPDLYGWIFLVLTAVPVVGLVVIGSRNLDAISELLFHKASADAGLQRTTSGGSHTQRGTTPAAAGERAKELSAEDMDKLIRLKTLLDQGAITQADFDVQKRMLLQEPAEPEEPAELQRLKQLLDAEVLTQEEYDVQKERFLARL